jgi:hypothetical protein
MGRYYFDTSTLVKNDHAEAGTADVHRMLGETASEFFISRLATVAAHSAAIAARPGVPRAGGPPDGPTGSGSGASPRWL